jgi:hypothetical protein
MRTRLGVVPERPFAKDDAPGAARVALVVVVCLSDSLLLRRADDDALVGTRESSSRSTSSGSCSDRGVLSAASWSPRSPVSVHEPSEEDSSSSSSSSSSS